MIEPKMYPLLLKDSLDNTIIIYTEWDSVKETRIEKLRTIISQNAIIQE